MQPNVIYLKYFCPSPVWSGTFKSPNNSGDTVYSNYFGSERSPEKKTFAPKLYKWGTLLDLSSASLPWGGTNKDPIVKGGEGANNEVTNPVSSGQRVEMIRKKSSLDSPMLALV